jgi:hypothetical protein
MIIPPVECRPVGGWDPQTWNLEEDLLDPVPDVPGCELSDAEIHWIEAWNDFVVGMWEEREGRRLPGFPLWGDDWVHRDELSIPPKTPKWKYDFLRKNAEFYTEHQEFIDDWSEKWEFHTDKFPPSRRKFEWQAQDTPDLWSTVMHLRPSGIRAKRPTYLPALVAITQTSIIGPLWEKPTPELRQVHSPRGQPIRPCCTTAADRHTTGVHSLPGDGRGHLTRRHRPRESVPKTRPLISNVTTPPSGGL